MIDLYKFEDDNKIVRNKTRVKINALGNKYEGLITGFATRDENYIDEDIDEASIEILLGKNWGVAFYESQIESIEII